MDNTNSHIFEMQSHNRRNAQMRQMGSWFGDVDLAVDDFRDSVSRKLDQLNMSLQRPKIPVPGFGAQMMGPLGTSAAAMPFAQSPAPTILLVSGTQNPNSSNAGQILSGASGLQTGQRTGGGGGR